LLLLYERWISWRIPRDLKWEVLATDVAQQMGTASKPGDWKGANGIISKKYLGDFILLPLTWGFEVPRKCWFDVPSDWHRGPVSD
jgi:hypothetical protein